MMDRDYHWYDAVGSEVFRSLVERCADGIVIVDLQHRISCINPAAEELFGYPSGSLLGQSLHQLLPQPFRAAHLDLVDAFWGEECAGRHVDSRNWDIRGRRADGSEFPADISILRSSEAGAPVLVAIVRDRTSQQQREQELARLADTDPLTHVLNRRGFLNAAGALAAGVRRHGRPLGIAIADIDHFKQINDTHGHLVGDAILGAVVDRLSHNLRDADLIARWGGEEFVALLTDADHRGTPIALERARQAIAAEPTQPASVGIPIPITVSIGATVSNGEDTLEELLRYADDALYQAKQAGRNRTRVFLPW